MPGEPKQTGSPGEARFKVAAAPFPPDFLWGAATAAHQIEGNNINSDFWVLEHLLPSPFAEPSGDACDSFHRFDEDIKLLAGLGLNTYRFSVEWARIEPEKGAYSRAMLDYYRRVAATCREQGLTPIATLHHFTSPRWLAGMNAWESGGAVDLFARYGETVAKSCGDLLGAVCTINEPNQPVKGFLFRGSKPEPGADLVRAAAARAVGSDRFSSYGLGDALKIQETMIAAHLKSASAVKSVNPHLPVGLTLALAEMSAAPGGEDFYQRIFEAAHKTWYDVVQGDDFVGIQTYTRQRIGPAGVLPPEQATDLMGFEIRPEALESTIREAARQTGRPILITENGLATGNDRERVDYIRKALRGVRRCLADGLDVRGYIHWSLLDNFEWLKGYAPTYGLVAVDRTTFRRTPKPSARVLGRIARSNGAALDDEND
jgi:beta-glucosidase